MSNQINARNSSGDEIPERDRVPKCAVGHCTIDEHVSRSSCCLHELVSAIIIMKSFVNTVNELFVIDQ